MKNLVTCLCLLPLLMGCAPVYDLGPSPSLRIAEAADIDVNDVLLVAPCEYAITFEDKRQATWQHGIVGCTTQAIYVFNYQGRNQPLKRVVNVAYAEMQKVALDSFLDSLQVHVYMSNYMLVVVPTPNGKTFIDRASTRKVHEIITAHGVTSIKTADPVFGPEPRYVPIVIAH